MPYDYLFNEKFRKSIDLDFKNAILILDEAHNCEEKAEESYSC